MRTPATALSIAVMVVSSVLCQTALCGPAQQTQQGGTQGTGRIVATVTNLNGHLSLYRGQCFDVLLADRSASTGFQWQTSASPNGVVRKVASSITMPDGPPGTAGSLTMTFRAERRGVAHIYFQQVRPWEGGDAGPINHLTVYVY
jgi:hypothetical protein